MPRFPFRLNMLALPLLCVTATVVSAQDTDRQSAPARPSNAARTDAAVKAAAADAARRPSSDDAWVVFGDVLMQKGRETADAAYCGRAEKAYRKALDLNSRN